MENYRQEGNIQLVLCKHQLQQTFFEKCLRTFASLQALESIDINQKLKVTHGET